MVHRKRPGRERPSIELSTLGFSLELSKSWIEELRCSLGMLHEADALRALRATLHALRDRLMPSELTKLSAQLPLPIRGLLFEDWRPMAKVLGQRREEAFLDAIVERFGGDETTDARRIAKAVFKLLKRRAAAGEIRDLRSVIPHGLLGLWPTRGRAPASRPTAPPPVVRELMTRPLLTVTPDTPLPVALETMAVTEVRHLLVVTKGLATANTIPVRAAVGLLSNRDGLAILQDHPSIEFRLDELLVRQVMTPAPLVTIAPDAALKAAGALMHGERISALPVVDDDLIVGMLTSDDLLRSRAWYARPPSRQATEPDAKRAGDRTAG